MSLLKNLEISLGKNQRNIYFFLFILSFISRAIISYFYGDKSLENEWSLLVMNLYKHNTLSMLNFDGLLVPNLWMPPVYAYFIYLHSLIFGLEDNLASYVIVTQIVISSLTTIIFYKIITNFFPQKIAIIGAILFCLFPLIVYSSSQISSGTIYLFLLLTFILLILNLVNNNSKYLYKNFVLIGVLSGILILTRRDFILIYFFTLFYSFIYFKFSFKKIIFIFLVTTITISPYIARNYIVFDKIIVHSGFGYNLWKAYNMNAGVEGFYIESVSLKNKIEKVKKDNFYRINEDQIYLEDAKKFILENPKKSFQLFIKRFFSFYFIDLNSSQKNYYNFFHIFPNLIISFLSFFGLLFCNKRRPKYNYLILSMVIILLVYSLFALLPRYKLYILPFQIILCLSFLEFIKKKLIKNN